MAQAYTKAYNGITQACNGIAQACNSIKNKATQIVENIQETATNVKNKISEFCQNKYVKKVTNFFSSPVTILIMIQTATSLSAIILMKRHLNKLKDASKQTKNCIIDLAKKLKIQNPEKIIVKVIPDGVIKNAYTYLTGEIAVSKDFDADPYSNESKFVFGHELIHMKNKHGLKYFITMETLSAIFIAAIGYLRSRHEDLKKLPVFNKILNKVEKFSAMGKLNIIIYSSIFCNFIKRHIVEKTIGRAFEKQADLGAASLGKGITTSGINFFKWCNNENNEFKQRLNKCPYIRRMCIKLLLALRHFTDPHPSPIDRIGYLKKYSEINHSPTNIFAKIYNKISNATKGTLKFFKINKS
jgi:Zn-dependent protease with chaperone function